jgi:hypothetical protein
LSYIIINIFNLLPLVSIIILIFNYGFINLPKILGYGVGLIILVIYFSYIAFQINKSKLRYLLCFLNYFILCHIFLSYLVHFDNLNIIPLFSQASNTVLNSIIFSLLVLSQAILLDAIIIIFFWGYSFIGLDNSQKIRIRYIIFTYIFVQGIGIMVYPLVLVIDALVSSFGTTGHLNYVRPIIYSLYIIAVLSWLTILAIQYFLINEKIIGSIVEYKHFRNNNIKNNFIYIFGIFIIISTLFEFFRGLWRVWLGNAIWISLIFISLWMIFKYIFRRAVGSNIAS